MLRAQLFWHCCINEAMQVHMHTARADVVMATRLDLFLGVALLIRRSGILAQIPIDAGVAAAADIAGRCYR